MPRALQVPLACGAHGTPGAGGNKIKAFFNTDKIGGTYVLTNPHVFLPTLKQLKFLGLLQCCTVVGCMFRGRIFNTFPDIGDLECR